MNSKQMKYHFLRWMHYDKQCIAAATEYLNGSDVFGVNRSSFPIEVEVKCSLEDLMRELNTIKYILEGDSGIKVRKLYKYNKHHSYLLSESKWDPRPRYFYFGVTEDIADKALDRLNGMDFGYQTPIPYGLLTVRFVKGSYEWDRGRHIVVELKKPSKLTEKKFDSWVHFARKISNENLALREVFGKEVSGNE